MHRLWLLIVVVGLVLPAAACGGESASVAPTPGTVFAGPIEISEKATSATISLAVSEDGSSITSVTVTLTDLECDGFSAGSMVKEARGDFPVAGGKIDASLSGVGEIEGRFTSPTEASGTIDLALDIPMAGPCELGKSDWSAKTD